MHYTALTALALGTVLAAAAPTLSPRNYYVYATFYDDNACTQNPGEAVSAANPGCLNESGRHSIYFQDGTDDNGYNLVYSPSQNCPCQSYCYPSIAAGGNGLPKCVSLDGTPSAESYRFVGTGFSSGCDANNC